MTRAFVIALLGLFTVLQTRQSDPSTTMTLEDVIKLKEIGDIDVSADGQRVLYSLKTSELQGNRVETTLWIVRWDGATSRNEQVQLAAFSRPRWRGHSHDILFLAPHNGRSALWELRDGATEPTVVLDHEDGIAEYFPSPDGSAVAFTCTEGAAKLAEAQSRLRDHGAIMDTARHYAESTIANWQLAASELWLYDASTRNKKRVSLTPWREVLTVVEVDWSSDASKLAVALLPRHELQWTFPGFGPTSHVLIVDRATLHGWPLHDSNLLDERQPRWAPDGRSLLVLVKDLSPGIDHPLSLLRYGGEFRLVEVDPNGTERRRFSPPALFHQQGPHAPEGNTWWTGDGRTFQSMTAPDGLTETVVRLMPDAAPVALTSEEWALSGCALAQEAPVLACVSENVSEPPEVTRVDVNNGTTTRLTAVNGSFKRFRLPRIEPFYVRNRFGFRTANLLVKPVEYQPGRRYPLLVVLYHFGNRFVTQAQLIPNFPIQAFARDGFAVWMANYPQYDGTEPPSRSGKFAIGYNPLATLEEGVAELERRGIADPAKVGIMGWSYGGFLTQFALTHSKTFAAGSVVDGGAWNPISYWVNPGDTNRSWYDETFGGPPEGKSLEAWKDFSPSLNVEALTVPVLFETHTMLSTMHVQHLDFITHASCMGAAIEGVNYFNAPHILTMPAQRLSSMERHLDWFKFWLKSERDNNPKKREQYERWHRLSDAQQRRVSEGRPNTQVCRQ